MGAFNKPESEPDFGVTLPDRLRLSDVDEPKIYAVAAHMHPRSAIHEAAQIRGEKLASPDRVGCQLGSSFAETSASERALFPARFLPAY